MKRKPWSLVILALLHVVTPFASLVLNAIWSGRTLGEQWNYWSQVIPSPLTLIYIYIGLPMLAGLFIFLCRRWSYWAYLTCITLIFISNIFSYATDTAVPTFIVLGAIALLDMLIVAYFMVPSVQKIYFDPRMRWWEAAPRYNFNHEGAVNNEKAFFKNLSLGGLFMTSGPSLEEGDKVNVTWNFRGQEQAIAGLVVYKSKTPEAPGYGVRFTHTAETQKQLKSVIDQLHSEGALAIERIGGPEDSFGNWLKKLLRTGEGLFPKIKS